MIIKLQKDSHLIHITLFHIMVLHVFSFYEDIKSINEGVESLNTSLLLNNKINISKLGELKTCNM